MFGDDRKEYIIGKSFWSIQQSGFTLFDFEKTERNILSILNALGGLLLALDDTGPVLLAYKNIWLCEWLKVSIKLRGKWFSFNALLRHSDILLSEFLSYYVVVLDIWISRRHLEIKQITYVCLCLSSSKDFLDGMVVNVLCLCRFLARQV